MKKAEILYPELCNLFGDTGNTRFIRACAENCVDTALNEVPAFVGEDVGLVYLGSMTENNQLRAMEKLMPYKDRIAELIDKGTVFIATGNSYEIFGKSLTDEDGSRIQLMGIFDFTVKRNFMKRESGLCIGKYGDIEIVGFKASFTKIYPGEKTETFISVSKGLTMNPESGYEGVVRNNFYGTALLGPLLVLNPIFSKKVFETAEIMSGDIPFYKEMMDAYKIRTNEFKQKHIGIH